ncbi:hypothetical protein K402DRAFT_424687 [Aulographum hederae CBS 113979]|uniref:Protein kinase domain-containing protein n=1 Tax=Aulographum hederae CBS 113979 TaxID=1176131 RepID=A0A6G1GNB7_9PEZI|nr:hypothetical protein K402DRAFT_424687 [Aulographum hederae CBS 113979]
MADPVSAAIGAASLGLGAASLAIQIFEGVKTGYGYFQLAANIDKDCESFRIRLLMEYTRMIEWGDAAGLSRVEDHPAFDRKMRAQGALIMAVLGEMNSLLGNLRQIGLQYEAHDLTVSMDKMTVNDGGDKNDSKTSLLGTQAASPVDLSVFNTVLSTASAGKDSKRHMSGFNHIIGLSKGSLTIAKDPRRISWAMRDHNKFKEGLVRLKQLTDYLGGTLRNTQQEILLQTTRETFLGMLQLSTSVAEIKTLLSAVQVAPLPACDDDGASIFSQATTLIGSDEGQGTGQGGRHNEMSMFEKLVRFRAVYAELETVKDIEVLKYTLLKDVEALKIEVEEGGELAARTMGKYQGKIAWVEWKKYREISDGIRDGETIWKAPDVAIENVRRLVALMQRKERPVEFRVPTCLGYVQDLDNSRFGFVYQQENPAAGQTEPKSLLSLLGGDAPSLTVRMRLAQSLATSILYLHAVSWLHKGLRSASVLFFDHELDNPYITGFEYARPDRKDYTATAPPADLEWAIYCHPEYQGPNNMKAFFKKTFDIYAFGIILLEIAYWKPAEEILGFVVDNSKIDPKSKEFPKPRHDPNSLQATRAIRARLIEDEPQLLSQVRILMGDRYHDALKACIEGLSAGIPEGSQADPVVSTLIQQAYLRLVVDKMGGIVV